MVLASPDPEIAEQRSWTVIGETDQMWTVVGSVEEHFWSQQLQYHMGLTLPA